MMNIETKSRLSALLSGLLLLAVNLGFSQLSGDSYASALSSKSAKVQYNYVEIDGFISNKDGKVEGLLVDLMSEFESYLKEEKGISITSTYSMIPNSNFQKFLDEVKNGRGGVFGLSTTTIREDRKEFLLFSEPYVNNISVLVSHKSVPTLTSMDKINSEFKNLSAYTAPGTTYAKRVDDVKMRNFPELKVNPVASDKEIIKSVLSDKNSFGFVDIGTYLEYLTAREPIKRHPNGDLEGEQFGIIMPKNSDWEPVLSAFLSSGFLESPKYRQLVTENLGKGALRMLD